MTFGKVIRTVIIICMSVSLSCICGNTVHAAGTNAGGEVTSEDVADFVRSFYEMHTKEEIDNIKEQLLGESSSYIVQFKASFEIGLQKLENINVYIYPLKKNGYWLAETEYEALFDGIDIMLPGWQTELVQEQEDGSLKIVLDFPRDLYDEVMEIMDSEECKERMFDLEVRFSEILDTHPEILKRLVEMDSQKSAAIARALEEKDSKAEESTGQIQEKESIDQQTAGNDIYIVKKGDSLWKIAQNELGDGMLWSELYKLNQDLIGDNPDLILVGIQLNLNFIPKASALK